MPFLIAILSAVILLFTLLFAMFDLWLLGLVILISLTCAAVALLGDGRHAGVMYMTAIFAIVGPSKLIQFYPAIVLAISGHPGEFYWLAADSAGTPILMEYGKPGKPSVPYSRQQAGDTHSQVYTPYNLPLTDGGWGDNTPDWTSGLNMELDFVPGPVSVLQVYRISSHPIDEMFGPDRKYYDYAHDGQEVWPLRMRSQSIWGSVVVEYGTRTWIVLEQVFGLLGALVGYWGSVALQRTGLRDFNKRGADSG